MDKRDFITRWTEVIRNLPMGQRTPPATSEADHYYQCPHCGEAVDMRVLAQVIHHERDGHGRMGRES